MSTFAPKEVTPYIKSNQPQDPQSQRIYIDEQLRDISRSITTLHTAVEQLQAEIDIIWSVAGPRP
jgi:hypothetical protein